MKETTDWIERQAMENLRFRLSNAETLAKDAGALLTILLAGLAGGMAYLIKGIEAGPVSAAICGAAVFTVWLMGCAVVLLLRCIMTAELQVPANEPANLSVAYEMDLEKIRRFELENVQLRIDATRNRNARTANWLDRVRLMTALSPLGFALGVGLYFCALA